jgi:hypothetical protein
VTPPNEASVWTQSFEISVYSGYTCTPAFWVFPSLYVNGNQYTTSPGIYANVPTDVNVYLISWSDVILGTLTPQIANIVSYVVES